MIDEANAVVVVLVVGSVAFLLSLAAVPTVRRVALRTGVLDEPEQGKMHTGATPYFGGLAIGLTALLIPSLFQDWTKEAAYIGIAAIMVAVCGLLDDVRNIHPYVRLGVEVMAAGLAVHAGARVDVFDNWVDIVLTITWLVVITNSFNLLDNMDGVAGTIATATAGALVVAAVLQDQILVGALAAAVAGGCVGFLIYNWHPASIFMGDAGSLLLGFLLAVVSLKLRWSTGYGSSVTAVVLIMFPAVFDTTLVVHLTNESRTVDHGRRHRSHEPPPESPRPVDPMGCVLTRSIRDHMRESGSDGRPRRRSPAGRIRAPVRDRWGRLRATSAHARLRHWSGQTQHTRRRPSLTRSSMRRS